MREKCKNIIIAILVIISMFYGTVLIYGLLPFIKNDNLRNLTSNILYLIILLFIFRKEIISGFKNIKKDYKKIIDTGFKYWILGIFLMIVSNIIINYVIFHGDIASNEELVRETILKSPLYGFISAVIIAPILEEIIFRVSLKRCFKNKYIFSITTGIIFGLMHAISGLTAPLDLLDLLNLLYIIPYGALGYAFGMMYSETNNAFTSIFMHSLHNFISCTLIFIVLG